MILFWIVTRCRFLGNPTFGRDVVSPFLELKMAAFTMKLELWETVRVNFVLQQLWNNRFMWVGEFQFNRMAFLTYFSKIKVGLWNLQSVCLPLITFNHFLDFHEIWYEGNAIQGHLNAIIFTPIAPIILKLLRSNVDRWAFLNCRFGLFMFHGNHGNQVVYCSKFG
jgi:hypothetical protein